ncbi:4-oxalocrotonate decarboxylase [Bartonella sp. HY329]|uniref:2-keto-4-pentenoate hydratase n=1 Tax=unclassified Bartonella TaxID=2645622 RepID=UPI0021C6A022|nr:MULTISPECIES: fumarylacetoacetate hydrolase family protein [unclassified Bartonella]UXM95075.1 4-oxalocrotonate decarboxylase [Bartonella sp. HY329]UXN09398.1 4-oxalocrotonate decarboxylase [Bartonella sp. HY328]
MINLGQEKLELFAKRLDDAQKNVKAIAQLTDEVASLNKAEALAIQKLSMQERYKRGEKRIGVKMGLTSIAKMRQVNVDEVIWGRLTDEMLINEGGFVSRQKFIHPRAEPEIAFLLKRDLPKGATGPDIVNAIEAIMPAIEIIDSRYENFQFRLADVIADNSSSSGVMFGHPQLPRNVENLGMIMRFNGRPVEMGSSAAILGNPLRALTEAVRLTHEADEPLKAGDLVLAGASTAAANMYPGLYVSVEVQGLGSAGFTMLD